MKNRFKKLLGLGILAAVVIAAVPVGNVFAEGTANEVAYDLIKHEHIWFHLPPKGRTITGFCLSRGYCKYGRSNALKITFNVSDETYSGKPYSGLRIDGIDEWKAAGMPQDVYFYTDNKGRKYDSSNPPTEVGRYDLHWKSYRSIIVTFSKYMASFSILPPKNEDPNGNVQEKKENIGPNDNTPVNNENSNPNGNTPENNGNDSQNSSIPAGNEPASQSSDIPQGIEPTKPAFENKDCMDKVKDMAGAELVVLNKDIENTPVEDKETVFKGQTTYKNSATAAGAATEN